MRSARLEEAPALSELCMLSKAYWGYDDAFMEACREELTITQTDFDYSTIQIAEREGTLLGMAQLELNGDVASLEKLFVHPEAMGLGVGRALFQWAADEARAQGASFMTIEADPDAVPFYMRMGAKDDGQVPSGSIPRRVLPKLRFDLGAV
ncbi:MAG: GNAT family N-acetyltransferase [Pseudomonadales bacterium]|nr:GNAT family N-acetyltransferase [Pseudomonadales bacterium]